MNRRSFLQLAAALLVLPKAALAVIRTTRSAPYQGRGPELRLPLASGVLYPNDVYWIAEDAIYRNGKPISSDL